MIIWLLLYLHHHHQYQWKDLKEQRKMENVFFFITIIIIIPMTRWMQRRLSQANICLLFYHESFGCNRILIWINVWFPFYFQRQNQFFLNVNFIMSNTNHWEMTFSFLTSTSTSITMTSANDFKLSNQKKDRNYFENLKKKKTSRKLTVHCLFDGSGRRKCQRWTALLWW